MIDLILLIASCSNLKALNRFSFAASAKSFIRFWLSAFFKIGIGIFPTCLSVISSTTEPYVFGKLKIQVLAMKNAITSTT